MPLPDRYQVGQVAAYLLVGPAGLAVVSETRPHPVNGAIFEAYELILTDRDIFKSTEGEIETSIDKTVDKEETCDW